MTLATALPTLAPGALAPRLAPPRPAPFPLDRLAGDPRARLYYLARNGIYHGLRALGVGRGDVVAMPAYHHGVEVEAVRATGAAVRFYRVDGNLRADLEHVERIVRVPGGRVRALYLTHFAGFAQPIAEARALARSSGLLLVEDCALALLSRGPDGAPLGQGADLAVYCLYKTLPVPHGGVAIARAPLPVAASPPIGSTLHHVAGSLLARAEARAGRLGAAVRGAARLASRRVVDRVVDCVQVGTQHLHPGELGLGASALVPLLVERIDATMVAVRRRRNYRRLLEALGDERRVPTGALAPGEVPLFLPLLVDDRARALSLLAARGVEAIDFWSIGDPACDLARFAEVAELRRRLIEVPIHQDLDDEAVDALAGIVKEALHA
jgi:hypothetical protein